MLITKNWGRKTENIGVDIIEKLRCKLIAHLLGAYFPLGSLTYNFADINYHIWACSTLPTVISLWHPPTVL